LNPKAKVVVEKLDRTESLQVAINGADRRPSNI